MAVHSTVCPPRNGQGFSSRTIRIVGTGTLAAIMLPVHSVRAQGSARSHSWAKPASSNVRFEEALPKSTSSNRKSGDKSLFTMAAGAQTTIVMLVPGSIKQQNLSSFLEEALVR